MSNRCRLCTTNDREALVEDLAAEMWATRDEHPWTEAGDWAEVMRAFAAATIRLLERDHGRAHG